MNAMNVRRTGVLFVCASATALVLAAGITILKGTAVAAYSPDDAAVYAQVVETLRKELAIPFSSPDDPGLLDRRERLRKLFAGVPPAYAKTLFDRLGTKATSDDLSREFHYRLSTATRQELLQILANIPAPEPAAPAATPAPASVWGTHPLPASEAPRFDRALRHLEELVNNSADDRKWRYQCWFDKLKAGDVDDRVIQWSRICPAKTGAIGAAYIVGPCDITWGMGGVSQDDIYNNIHSIADVDANGDNIDIFTHLKSEFVVSEEMTALPLENLRGTHDMVVMAIDKLGKWADNPMGGSSAMPKGYVSIKDWIGQRQRDPNSVYSCK